MSTTVVDITPKSVKERVDWAVTHKKICVFNDQKEIGCRIPLLPEDGDREVIEFYQKRYENAYNAKKEELRAEKEKSREEEKKKRIAALLEEYPEMVGDIGFSSNNAKKPDPNKKPRTDEFVNRFKKPDSPLCSPWKKSKSQNTRKAFERGQPFPEPCKECKKKLKRCHKQDPMNICCWECRSARKACSFKMAAELKGAAAKKKETSSESDEEYYEEDAVVIDRAGSTRSHHTSVASAIEKLTAEIVKIRTAQERIASAIENVDENVDGLSCYFKAITDHVLGFDKGASISNR